MPWWQLVHEGKKSYHSLACSSVYLSVNWVQGHEMFWLLNVVEVITGLRGQKATFM